MTRRPDSVSAGQTRQLSLPILTALSWGRLLAVPAMPAPLPAGVPNPTSIPELAVQLRIGAGGLLHAPMAVAVFVLLAPDQRISLRVKPTVCSPRHASESPRSVTKEEADSLSGVRRRRNVHDGKHTPPRQTPAIDPYSVTGAEHHSPIDGATTPRRGASPLGSAVLSASHWRQPGRLNLFGIPPAGPVSNLG
jgi:hypothetical protein